jgi:hypothetical protein
MQSKLIENSKQLSSTAQKILEKTKVVQILSHLGQVETIGSLRLQLMYRLDIDLFVLSDTVDKDKAREITKLFIDQNMFQTVALADCQTYPEKDFPKGFYWELKVVDEDKYWKFDIWYLKPEEEYAKLVLGSIKKFEPELQKHPQKVELILQIKQAYFDGVKYKDKVKGFDIYTAVLENGIESIEAFEKWTIQK